MSADRLDLETLRRTFTKSKGVWQSQEDMALAHQLGQEEWRGKKGDNVRNSILQRTDRLLARSFHQSEVDIISAHKARMEEIAKADEVLAAKLHNDDHSVILAAKKQLESDELKHFESLMSEEKARQEAARAREVARLKDEELVTTLSRRQKGKNGQGEDDSEETLARLVQEDERLARLLGGDSHEDEDLARRLQEGEEAAAEKGRGPGIGGKGKGKAAAQPTIEDRVMRLEAEGSLGAGDGASAADIPDEEREFLQQQQEALARVAQEHLDAQIARRLSLRDDKKGREQREERRKTNEPQKKEEKAEEEEEESEEPPEVEFGFGKEFEDIAN